MRIHADEYMQNVYKPNPNDTDNKEFTSSLMYMFLLLSDLQRACLHNSLSLMPAPAALETAPDRSECKQKSLIS